MQKLTHLSLLELHGDDCADFLQGQLTNDLQQLNARWQYSGYCTPKGRLFALLQLWRVADKYYVLLDSSLVDSTVQRLRMYVMRSKVNIDVIDTASVYALDVNELEARCGDFFSDSELADLAASEENPARQLYSQSDGGRFSLLQIGQHALFVAHDGDIVNAADTVQPDWWLATEIAHGRPRVTLDSQEMFIPQMLNLDILDGINFKKGCYTGQEIVARMHYLGKLKQRMYVCSASSEGDLQIGQKIFSDAELQAAAGNIVSCTHGGDKLLAVLRMEQVANKTVAGDGVFYSQDGTSLTVSDDQPYPLP